MAISNESLVDEKVKVDSLKIPLDPIHGGIRMAIMGSFLGVGAVSFAAGMFLTGGFLPSVIISTGVAAGTSMGLEHVLKDQWPSGREFVADSERIALTKHNKIEAVIDVNQAVQVLMWRFEVKKETPRAKKGWQLLGLGLEQDDNTIVVYSASSADEYETMPLASSFTILNKADKEKQTNLSSSRSMRQAGEQKRLHDAEVVRQIMGGDMMFEDFLRTIDFLQAHYPQWMTTV